jgi:hypothetical protein
VTAWRRFDRSPFFAGLCVSPACWLLSSASGVEAPVLSEVVVPEPAPPEVPALEALALNWAAAAMLVPAEAAGPTTGDQRGATLRLSVDSSLGSVDAARYGFARQTVSESYGLDGPTTLAPA